MRDEESKNEKGGGRTVSSDCNEGQSKSRAGLSTGHDARQETGRAPRLVVFSDPEKCEAPHSSERRATTAGALTRGSSPQEADDGPPASGPLTPASRGTPEFPSNARRIARGFTITVSPPVDFNASSLSQSPGESGREGDMQGALPTVTVEVCPGETPFGAEGEPDDEMLLPRRPSRRSEADEGIYLAPEEIVPEVTLDKTESRLPSLENMLADEELRKLLNTSEIHREVQELLMTEDEQQKYENIMKLVQTSFHDAEWRKRAAEDKGLLDTLLLLCRQKLALSQNPFQYPGGDFMPRSRSRYRTLTSKTSTLSRSASGAGGNFPQRQNSGGSPTAGSAEPGQSPRSSMTGDLNGIKKSVMALALVAATLKLLRNLCVGSVQCQEYLHDLRIVDLLFNNLDGIMEVTQRAFALEERYGPSSEWVKAGGDPSCMFVVPDWVKYELQRFVRYIVQLLTNTVSGSQKLQEYRLKRIFPETLLITIVLLGDSELLSCLLFSLFSKQPSEVVCDTLVADPDGVKVLYFWLASCVEHQGEEEAAVACTDEIKGVFQSTEQQLSKSSSPSGLTRRQTTKENMWATIFLTLLLKRDVTPPEKSGSVFTEVLRQLTECDPFSFRQSLPPSRPTLTRAGSHCKLASRKASFDAAAADWHDSVSARREALLRLPKGKVLSRFYVLLESLFDAELVQCASKFKEDSLLAFLCRNPKRHLAYVTERFTVAADALEELTRGGNRKRRASLDPRTGALGATVSTDDQSVEDKQRGHEACGSPRSWVRWTPDSLLEGKDGVTLGCFRALVRMTGSLAAGSCLLPSELSAQRESFDAVLGLPVLKASLQVLSATGRLRASEALRREQRERDAKREQQVKAADTCGGGLSEGNNRTRNGDGYDLDSDLMPDAAREALLGLFSPKDLLLLIANLCYKNPRMQGRIGEEGLQVLLKHGYVDDSDPLMREASIYAIRNCCANNEENQRSLQAALAKETTRGPSPQRQLQLDGSAIINSIHETEAKIARASYNTEKDEEVGDIVVL